MRKKSVDSLEKRLTYIRIHLLTDKTAVNRTHDEPTLVLDPFLYLGGLSSLRKLDSLHMTHVLSLVFYPLKTNAVPEHVEHLFLKTDDTIAFNISVHFDRACQFIESARQANGRVLIHCALGVSRSSTICCAYLIKYQRMSVEEALSHLRSRRSIIQPNSGFLRQLLHFSQQINNENHAT